MRKQITYQETQCYWKTPLNELKKKNSGNSGKQKQQTVDEQVCCEVILPNNSHIIFIKRFTDSSFSWKQITWKIVFDFAKVSSKNAQQWYFLMLFFH